MNINFNKKNTLTLLIIFCKKSSNSGYYDPGSDLWEYPCNLLKVTQLLGY